MLRRRDVPLMGLGLVATTADAQSRRTGRLVVIGGAEDRLHDKVILKRFTELCGGPGSRIRVLSAASSAPERAWDNYQRAFGELGVSDCAPIPIPDRAAADTSAVTDLILEADGIFISGGDQRRLMDLLWETDAFRALHVAFHLRGCCIGGTSAGAAALSRHMLVRGEAVRLPEKEAAELDIGLGFIGSAIVDQHFSERGRLARLLSAITQRPELLGVGVDEDTALVIERDSAIEVIGQGAVTLVDARDMRSNNPLIEAGERLEMLDVRLHVLPAGHRYSAHEVVQRVQQMPPRLRTAIGQLVAPGPIRG